MCPARSCSPSPWADHRQPTALRRVILVQRLRTKIDSLAAVTTVDAAAAGVGPLHGVRTVSQHVAANSNVDPADIRADQRIGDWLNLFPAFASAAAAGRLTRAHIRELRHRRLRRPLPLAPHRPHPPPQQKRQDHTNKRTKRLRTRQPRQSDQPPIPDQPPTNNPDRAPVGNSDDDPDVPLRAPNSSCSATALGFHHHASGATHHLCGIPQR